MKKITVLAALVVLFSATTLFAQCTTIVPGGIISGEIWTPAGSPYCVEGDLIINNLVIEPDVRVQFLENYVFEVAGALTAIGTKESPIVFTRDESNTVGWQGIFFNKNLPGCELAYCSIEGSINSGIRIMQVPEPPIIRNCDVLNNSRLSQGGGIRISGSGLVTLEGCTIDHNEAFHTGGGQPYGGGICVDGDLTVIGCTVINNKVKTTGSTGGNKYSRGGGIYANGTLTLSNSFIESNVAEAHGSNSGMYAVGGGVYVTGNAAVTNCLFIDNESYATESGWGTPYEYGGGIYVSGTSTVVDVTNTTIRSNVAGTCGGGVHVSQGTLTATNSIVWGNTSTQIYGPAMVTYSDVEGGYPGEGNIDLNPVFVDEYHIDCSVSPCIDAGTNDAPKLPDTDIDGEPRICDGDNNGSEIVDMGADECCGDGPAAEFSGNPTDGPAPLAVDFTDESVAEITTWSWDFGDGETSTAQNPSHTYNTPGTYTVSLTVTGPGGTDTETKIDYITVSDGWEGAYDTLFRHPSDLTLLRQYRDEFLIKTTKGKLYTKLLYNRSEKALQVLLQNPELMMEAKHLIEANKVAVSEALNGNEGVIYNTDEIVSFLKAYAKKSPPDLKLLAITVEKEMLRQQRQGEKFLGFRLK